MTLSELKPFLLEITNLSGNIIKEYFRKTSSFELKKDNSPVTIADKKAEEILRNEIMKRFPEHGIIGEEFGITNENAEYKWILDPIDGTKSFIAGAYTFGTLIGLTRNDEPLIGVIHQPILNEFLIGDNETAELNDVKVKVAKKKELKDCLLLTTDHLNFYVYQDGKKFENLIRKVNVYRMWGDCYGYLLVASGFADIMIDPIMSIWDIAALAPIIKGAGGVITDIKGNDPMKGNSIIASNKFLHKLVIQELN